MTLQTESGGSEKELYDAVIFGGGIAGLVVAYMLRDKKILLLENEDRFGGRVRSERINEASYDIGTQFFNEEDTSFVHLVDELGVERITHDPKTFPIAAYLNHELYIGLGSLLNWRVMLDGVRLLSETYRQCKIFQLPPEDPRWRDLVKKRPYAITGGP